MGLCIVCFKEFKRSKEGRHQRSLKLQGLTNNYGPGRWPAHIDAGEGKRLCKVHGKEHQEKLTRTYQERETNCKALGFKSYKGYLKSSLWADIRKAKFVEASGICFCCGGVAKEIHHSSYNIDVLKGENRKELHAVCDSCHEKIEYFPSGDKSLPHQTMLKVKEIAQYQAAH